jgi:hypothetical protein
MIYLAQQRKAKDVFFLSQNVAKKSSIVEIKNN